MKSKEVRELDAAGLAEKLENAQAQLQQLKLKVFLLRLPRRLFASVLRSCR